MEDSQMAQLESFNEVRKEEEEDAKEKYENIYENSFPKDKPKKRKPRTQDDESKIRVKTVMKKSSNNGKKTKRENKFKERRDKIREKRKNTKKIARTPIKPKFPCKIFKTKKVSKIEQKKEKKFKENEDSDHNYEETQINLSQICDRKEELKDEGNFSSLVEDDKLSKEGLLSLEKLFSNDPKFERARIEEPENIFQDNENILDAPTETRTIFFQQEN